MVNERTLHKTIDEFRQKAIESNSAVTIYAVIFSNPSANATSRANASHMSSHAEFCALKNIYGRDGIKKKLKNGKKVKRYHMLVFRFTSDGILCQAKPCKECAHHIYNSEIIKKVHYTDEYGDIKTESPYYLLNSSRFIYNQNIIIFHNNGQIPRMRDRFMLNSHRFQYIPGDKIGKKTVKPEMREELKQFIRCM